MTNKGESMQITTEYDSDSETYYGWVGVINTAIDAADFETDSEQEIIEWFKNQIKDIS